MKPKHHCWNHKQQSEPSIQYHVSLTSLMLQYKKSLMFVIFHVFHMDCWWRMLTFCHKHAALDQLLQSYTMKPSRPLLQFIFPRLQFSGQLQTLNSILNCNCGVCEQKALNAKQRQLRGAVLS